MISTYETLVIDAEVCQRFTAARLPFGWISRLPNAAQIMLDTRQTSIILPDPLLFTESLPVLRRQR